ncbi:MAG: phenylacetate--CoA ligase family protein [Rhodocyclales bacterium]|nr:phenylacetate--CoA ligase family protein [Rhodocyclales bacterium]
MSGKASGLDLSAVRSAAEGIVWPGIPEDSSAQLLATCFQLDRSQWWTPEMLQEHQLRQLRLVLRHAQATVPYYSRTLGDMDVERLDWAGFLALPILQRSTVQAQFNALASRQPPTSHGRVSPGQSSGSTGKPIQFLFTMLSQLFWKALTLREHLWHNRDFTGKFSAIRVKIEDGHFSNWGPPVAEVFQTGPSATLNVRTDIAKQLEWLQREDPDYLITHASNLGALAELSIERGVRLPSLRQARTISETLRPDLRDRVREAWNVEIADVYSCEEVGAIALQCPQHEHYHVQSENLIVEVLNPDGKECKPGETGEVVLTTLHNFAMPLIRYRIGDYAEVGEACACGRGLPVLKRIHGRQRNMLKLPNGSQHWPSFPASLWRAIAPVEQFQLVQRCLDEIEANYVMSRDLDEHEAAQIVAALQDRLGFPFRIRLQRLPSIGRSAPHKFEDFISALP